MNTALLEIITSYQDSFIEKISEKFSIPKEELSEIWKNVSKIKTTTNKRKKKTKTISAYVNFCKEKRSILRATTPYMTFAEISKELARMWSELDEEAKMSYKTPSPSQEEETPVVSQQQPPQEDDETQYQHQEETQVVVPPPQEEETQVAIAPPQENEIEKPKKKHRRPTKTRNIV